MAKTDIFGIKPYRNTQVKSAKLNLGHCFVVAVRTDAEVLAFSTMLYTEANYLFSISEKRFQVKELNELLEFQSGIYKDIVSDNKLFYIQNTDFKLNKNVLGYNSQSLFQIKKLRRRRKNQLSLFFEKEEKVDLNELKRQSVSEIQNWSDFKADLAGNAVDVMDKIDYLFPIQIETYEIIKPLLLLFPKMTDINYMLIEPERISDAISFFMYIDQMNESIHYQNRTPSILSE